MLLWQYNLFNVYVSLDIANLQFSEHLTVTRTPSHVQHREQPVNRSGRRQHRTAHGQSVAAKMPPDLPTLPSVPRPRLAPEPF